MKKRIPSFMVDASKPTVANAPGHRACGRGAPIDSQASEECRIIVVEWQEFSESPHSAWPYHVRKAGGIVKAHC